MSNPRPFNPNHFHSTSHQDTVHHSEDERYESRSSLNQEDAAGKAIGSVLLFFLILAILLGSAVIQATFVQICRVTSAPSFCETIERQL